MSVLVVVLVLVLLVMRGAADWVWLSALRKGLRDERARTPIRLTRGKVAELAAMYAAFGAVIALLVVRPWGSRTPRDVVIFVGGGILLATLAVTVCVIVRETRSDARRRRAKRGA
jgi:hypothetical protein